MDKFLEMSAGYLHHIAPYDKKSISPVDGARKFCILVVLILPNSQSRKERL